MTLTTTTRRADPRRSDLFDVMRADLDLVNDRVAEVARVDYPAASALVSDIVRAGGKRLRPIVLLLAARSYAYDANKAALITAAAGVELLHTASLIHDDTVDRAAIRRGMPTLNSVLSSGAVILIGDYLFAQSAMLAAATGNVHVVTVFASTLGDICDGQLREMFHAHRLDQTREEYDARIFGKTASLFAGAAEMGAILSGAPAEHLDALRAFGADIGMAFQVIDDMLDVTGGTEDLGKPAGNDLRQGTVTLPTLLYADRLSRSSAAWQRLQHVLDDGAVDSDLVDETIADIRDSGAIEETFEVAESFVERAKARLIAVPDAETVALLGDVADFALTRPS